MSRRDELEDFIIELEQELAEAMDGVRILQARLESLTYELFAIDNEEF